MTQITKLHRDARGQSGIRLQLPSGPRLLTGEGDLIFRLSDDGQLQTLSCLVISSIMLRQVGLGYSYWPLRDSIHLTDRLNACPHVGRER